MLVGSLAVFGAATEDVTRHNGMAVRDAANLRVFIRHRSDLLVHVSKVLSDVGAVGVVAAVAVLASLLLWRRGLRVAVAGAPIAAFGVAAVTVSIVKQVVGRVRPPVGLRLVSESDASFPSGHATDSAAVLLTIALVVAVFVLRRPIARVLAVLSAGLLSGAVGASRLVLGVHWPSDVFAGWALGVSAALAVTIAAALVSRVAPPTRTGSAGWITRWSWRAVALLAARRKTGSDLFAS